MVSARVSSVMAREVRFADASLGLWPPVRLSVTAPALAEPGGFANGAALQARALHLDLDLPALFSRRIVVRRLTLDRPSVHLVLRADGTTNLDGLMKAGAGRKPAAGGGMSLAIRELRIDGGKVLVDDMRAARRTAFDIESRVSLEAEADGARFATAGETMVSGVAFGPLSAARLADLKQTLAALEWRLAHEGKFDAAHKRLALGQLTLGLGRAELALSGVIDEPGPRARVDLRARGTGVDLGQVLDFAAAADARAVHGIRGGGRLDFDLRVVGAMGPGRMPTLAGTLAIADGAFRYPGAPTGVEVLALKARFAPDSLTIGDARAKVSGQPVRAALFVTRFSDPWVRFEVQGDLDLAAVAPLVAPRDTKLGGRAAVNVQGSGRAKDPGAPAPAKPPIAPAVVNFNAASSHLDLADFLPTTPGAPILPHATGEGRVIIARLIHQKLDVQDVAARVRLLPGVLEVPEYSMRAYGGTALGNARFDLTDPTRPVFAVKTQVDSLEADAILAAWTPIKGLLKGRLGTTLNLSGAGLTPADLRQTVSAIGLALVSNGTLGPGPALEAVARYTQIPALKQLRFKDGRLPFRVERGRVVTDPVVFLGAHGEWRLIGSVGFDGTLDYAVSATLPPDVVAQLGARSALAAGALADTEGRLLLDLRVTGQAAAPQVAWDGGAMRDRLAGRASQAMEAQRAKLEADARAAAEARLFAAQDSARVAIERARRAAADSLKRRAGDALKGFFGSSRDTTKQP
jgi:hypothetical protein